MRVRSLPIFVLVCSCTEQTGLRRGDGAAAGSDGRGFADASDVAPGTKDAGIEAVTDGAIPATDLPMVHADGADSTLLDSAAEGLVADAVWDRAGADDTADLRDVPALDGTAADANSGCQLVVAQMTGDTVGGMANECAWTSVTQPSAPAAAIAVTEVTEAMSFRVRVDLDPETYFHQGYVSAPSLTEVGPLSIQGMDVSGPIAGTSKGQYFFDLRWANQVAPREGMRITLTASFSFACAPAMSRTIPASAKAELILCRGSSRTLVWRGPGESCDLCVGPAGNSSTDSLADL